VEEEEVVDSDCFGSCVVREGVVPMDTDLASGT